MASQSCHETISVLSPVESGKPKSFSFVRYTFGPDARSRKAIRSQAAKSSAKARIQTIAERQHTQERTPKRLKASVHLDPKASEDDSVLLRSSASSPSSDISRSNSVPLPSVTEFVNDWNCRLPSLIHQALNRAIKAIHHYDAYYDLSCLIGSLAKPGLYNDPLMLRCLELLVFAPSSTIPGHYHFLRSTAAFLRHQLIVAVQAAIREWQGSNWALAPVILLLAGWEVEHGDNRAAKFHLQAMCTLAPAKSSRIQMLHVPENLSIPALPAPLFLRSIPSGFEFFKSHNLLPPCLMNLIGSLKHLNPTIPGDSIQIRRFGLAAMACMPSGTDSFQALWDDEVAVLIALHVRLAAGLLSNMMLIGANDGLSDAQEELLAAMYPQTLSLDNSELPIGSIYDEILLWSLCVFCASTSEPASSQTAMIQKILRSNGMQTWLEMESLLERYIYPEAFAFRLKSVLDLVLE